ncbi:MAG: class I fructose-bisphosphate aldolase [Promethearchaeota archaeon]
MSKKNPYTGFKIRMEKMLIHGELGDKALFLACDQGFEHRADFTIPEAANPDYVMAIAEKAGIPLILHKGTYIRYADRHPDVPMVLKLNGKTELFYDNRAPQGGMDCTVQEALGICPSLVAVGYSLYVGGQHETEQLTELAEIVREARSFQLPVIVWAYVRQHNPRIKEEEGKWENVRYAARVAFENGADIVKLYYPENAEGLKKVKEYAPGIFCVIAGGAKADTIQIAYNTAYQIIHILDGMAIGRNIFQDPKPINKALGYKAIFKGKSVEDALEIYNREKIAVL